MRAAMQGAVVFGLLASAAPAGAQAPPPSPEAGEIAACLCLEQSIGMFAKRVRDKAGVLRFAAQRIGPDGCRSGAPTRQHQRQRSRVRRPLPAIARAARRGIPPVVGPDGE